MPKMARVFIALGANQNAVLVTKSGTSVLKSPLSPPETFRRVMEMLKNMNMRVTAVSGLWQSPAWPDPSLPPYRNAVIRVDTSLSPAKLLAALKHIERQFGRNQNGERNASRPLDLDIIDYNGRVMETETLSLPHPRMLARGFVLLPLQEIAPNWCDPIQKRTIQNWTARLPLSATRDLNWLGRL